MKLSIKDVSGKRRTSYPETTGETESIKGVSGQRTSYQETTGETEY